MNVYEHVMYIFMYYKVINNIKLYLDDDLSGYMSLEKKCKVQHNQKRVKNE